MLENDLFINIYGYGFYQTHTHSVQIAFVILLFVV